MTRIVSAALAGGLAAGALDIAYAFIVFGFRGVSPVTILQSVASGVLGRPAYQGGAGAAALGAALHFGMAVVMALAFALLARLAPLVLRRPIAAGVAYGLVIFGVMYFVVVPLSAAYPGNVPQGWLLAGSLMAHTALVGVPIALIAARVLRQAPDPASAI
jgi:hypothetical protein